MATRARRKRTEHLGERSKPAPPDDACPNCGTVMRERKAILRIPVNGEEIGVPGAPHLRCPRCHEVVLRMDQARQLRERALEAYRTRYELLSAAEIRAIREEIPPDSGPARAPAETGRQHDLALGSRPERADGRHGRAPATHPRHPGEPHLPEEARGLIRLCPTFPTLAHGHAGSVSRMQASASQPEHLPRRQEAAPPAAERGLIDSQVVAHLSHRARVRRGAQGADDLLGREATGLHPGSSVGQRTGSPPPRQESRWTENR